MRGAFPPEHDGWPRYGIERRFLDRKQSGTTDVIIRLCTPTGAEAFFNRKTQKFPVILRSDSDVRIPA